LKLPHLELPHLEKEPRIPDSCYIDVSARINGDVTMGEDGSVWFHVSIRGDVHWIRIGDRVNVQDGCIFHTSYQVHPLEIGDDVSFGHGVIAHGCRIGSRVLVGMHSVIMDGAVIGDDVLIGAGSLVTENKTVPSGTLAFGRPAKVIRELTAEEREMVAQRSIDYAAYAQSYRRLGRFTGWRDNPWRRPSAAG